MKTIILSEKELNVLVPHAECNKTIDWFLKFGKPCENKKMVISIDGSKCEEVRTALTELLAKIGFDANYSPTKEGRVLEELIDKLFIG
jgi:hypothetical protein